MPKLTESGIAALVPKNDKYKVYDQDGLYLVVNPTGKKSWMQKFTFAGARPEVSIGSWPALTRNDAYRKVIDNLRLIESGINPKLHKRAAKIALVGEHSNSFEFVAREWFEKKKLEWAESHSSKIIRRLELYVFPVIGKLPVAQVTTHDCWIALEKIEKRGTIETAHRARTNLGQVLRYAVATGRRPDDPTTALRGALKSGARKHFASLTKPDEVRDLLQSIDSFVGTPPVMMALRLSPLLFVRPGEVRQMEWAELDLENRIWTVPAGKMKKRRMHLVPLSSQAMAILQEMQQYSGECRYVFPGARDRKKRCMSDAAINAALRRMGYDTTSQMTGHGFRAMAKTLLKGTLKIDNDVIKKQMAHKLDDEPLGEAYDRNEFWFERVEMMQIWSDYLDQLKKSA